MRVLVALVLALGALAWLAHGAAMVGYPFQYDYGEGGTMIASLRLARGESIYPDIQEPPFLVNPYTPIYLWAGSLFMGDGPTMLGGRLVSFMSAATVAGLLFAMLRRRAGLDAALAGTAVFLVHPLVVGWSPLYRTDMLALLFGFLGLEAADSALRERGAPAWRDALVAVPLALAFYTKQSMVAPLLAAVVAFWWEDRRRALRFTAALGTWLALPAAGLEAATGGRFLTMVFGYNVMPFHPLQAVAYLGGYLRSALALVALALVGARHPGGARERLWWLFLAASVPIAVGTGRQGGFYNYCLEMHLALSVLAGLAWGAAARAGGRAAWAPAALLLAQLALGASTRLPPYLFSPVDHLRFETGSVIAGQVPDWVQRSMGPAEAAAWLRAHPGPILAENLANPTVLGRTPWVVDPLILFTLAASGRWNPEPVLERIDRREFALVFLQVLDGNIRFPPYALQRILANYRVAGKAGEDFVLVPLGPAGGRPGPTEGARLTSRALPPAP